MENEKFYEQIKALGKRALTLEKNITTEEATKTSLLMPFLQTLGYDIFNPLEVVPEFTADVGIKKGEKVDYAIMIDGKPAILIEAKSITEKLTKHDSQLFRYFGTTTAKFGILTNGKEYKFFTDLDTPNKMDTTPFLTIDIRKIKDSQIKELSKFHKEVFDMSTILSSASELKYLDILKSYLTKEFDDADEEFCKFILLNIYDGLRTKSTIEKFAPLIKKGLAQFINERVNEKLSSALNTQVDADIIDQSKKETQDEEKSVTIIEESPCIITTPEEIETYTTVKVLLSDVISPERIFYRDNLSYFNILVDDSRLKWILRVYTKSDKLQIVFNDSIDRVTRTTVDILQPIDLVNYSKQLHEAVEQFI